MTEEKLKAQPWTVERAIGTIGAFIEGGEPGEALNVVDGWLKKVQP